MREWRRESGVLGVCLLKLNWSLSFEWGELIQSCKQARYWSRRKTKEFSYFFN